MKKIQFKIVICLFSITLITSCHTLEHKSLVISPKNKLSMSKKTDDNNVNNNENKLLTKKEDVSNKKIEKAQKIITKTPRMPIISKSKKIEKKSFDPESIINLSEKQLFKKMGKSDFVKHEGKLKNHQYYFSNCFVDVFVIKKENGYFVNFIQGRPVKLNGFLNEKHCFKEISKKIKSLKK